MRRNNKWQEPCKHAGQAHSEQRIERQKAQRNHNITTGKGNKHTSNTNHLLVKLTIIRWKHARERINLHEAYYWMDKQEETMWAKDKICFQQLALSEMKQNTNTDKWVGGMIGTEIEVARTIEAWMQRRGGLEHEPGRKKRILHQHFPTPHWY
jgi:hypothetical protein